MAKTLPQVPPDNLLKIVPESHLVEIGRVITQWSMLESVVETAAWRIARVRNDRGRCITAQMQMQSKLDLLQSLLAQERFPALAEQFKNVSDYVRECLLGRRNTVAHGLWAALPGLEKQALVSKFSAKGRLVSQGKFFEPDELRTIATHIAEVTSWVIDLCELLPQLKQRPGGLGHKTPDPQNPQGCATRRQRALQPPIRRRKAPPQPKKKPQRQKG